MCRTELQIYQCSKMGSLPPLQSQTGLSHRKAFLIFIFKISKYSHEYLLFECSLHLSYFISYWQFHLTFVAVNLFIYLFGVLRRFQHCTGHITTGSWKGRGNQYIQFVRVLYCKLPTNGKQLPAFPLEALPGIEPWPQRWEAIVAVKECL